MIYLVSPNDRKYLISAGDRMPLGLLYISAALKKKGYDHKVIDMNHERWTDILSEIKAVKPEVVGLSVLSTSYPQMRRFAEEVSIDSPNTQIVAGGFHVTNQPGCFSDIAVEMRGYGESEMINFMEDLGRFETFDINRYPIPNRQALPKERYKFTLEGLTATTMITSRGCPHNCSFCSNWDKEQKRRSIDNIAEEAQIIRSMGYSAVYLVDDSFTLNRQFSSNVGAVMRQNGLKFRVETRVNTLDYDTIDQLADSGCIVAGIGIESGSQTILDKTYKGIKKEQVINAVKRMTERGIKTKGFFIIGLPGETVQTAVETIDFSHELRKMGLSYADFYPLTPFPGSPIARDPAKYGIEILDRNLKHYVTAGKEVPMPVCRPKLPHPAWENTTQVMNPLTIRRLCQEARNSWKS